MSLDVALQSVAFYVLSCATCAKISHRRKAKLQAKKERAEKQHLETEQPGLYRHPSPFSTNPYWHEEILMGPSLPKNKADRAGSKNASMKALNMIGPGSSIGSTSEGASTDAGSSPTAVTEGSRISGEGWNLKRYQREDEALWGHGDAHGPGHRLMDAITKAGNSAGRLLEGRLSSKSTPREQNPESYYHARNPPVNDLHPPVVSTAPRHKAQTRWMLQPPPSAKIMEGKERVTRSRSVSNTSRRTDGTPLSRQVTERLMEAKLQRGETPESLPETKVKTRRDHKSDFLGKRLDWTPDGSSSSSDSTSTNIKRTRRPPPISTSASYSSKSRDTVEHIPIPSDKISPSASGAGDLPFRPQLSTITSESETTTMPGCGLVARPLQELSPRSSASVLNSCQPSPSRRLSPQANSMPASIPSVDSKLPAARTITPAQNISESGASSAPH